MDIRQLTAGKGGKKRKWLVVLKKKSDASKSWQPTDRRRPYGGGESRRNCGLTHVLLATVSLCVPKGGKEKRSGGWRDLREQQKREKETEDQQL